MSKFLSNPATRGWIYNTLVALGAVAVLYGVITIEQSEAWLGVASAVLLIGSSTLARLNLNKPEVKDPGRHAEES